MSTKRHKPEEIVSKLRQVEVLVGQGQPRIDAIREVQITEQTYYRWRKQYGGMGTNQLKELKRLQKENERLRRAVSDLTLDKLILKEALEGNWQASPAAGSVLIIFNPSLASRNVMPVMLSGSIARHNGSHRVRDRMKMN